MQMTNQGSGNQVHAHVHSVTMIEIYKKEPHVRMTSYFGEKNAYAHICLSMYIQF